MPFVFARRTQEIGLRIALGAPQAFVLWLVLREVLILVEVGLAIGVPDCVWHKQIRFIATFRRYAYVDVYCSYHRVGAGGKGCGVPSRASGCVNGPIEGHYDTNKRAGRSAILEYSRGVSFARTRDGAAPCAR
jgi:hypothetical protein